MEVVSLHTELQEEDGGVVRVCYRLLEEKENGEPLYGLLSFVEGADLRSDQRCWLPDVFENRWLGQAVLEFLAGRGVMPVHIETVLRENLL